MKRRPILFSNFKFIQRLQLISPDTDMEAGENREDNGRREHGGMKQKLRTGQNEQVRPYDRRVSTSIRLDVQMIDFSIRQRMAPHSVKGIGDRSFDCASMQGTNGIDIPSSRRSPTSESWFLASDSSRRFFTVINQMSLFGGSLRGLLLGSHIRR